MSRLDNVFFEDLEDMLKIDKPTQARPSSAKSNTKDKGYMPAQGVDEDIQFFENQNDFFVDGERQKSSTLQKYERKMDVRSATTIDFNRKTKKADEFDELLGGLDNKSSLKPTSSHSQRNLQGQYNQSQMNYFQDLNDELDDDYQKKSQMGMTGMTLQTTYSKNEDFFPRQFTNQLSQQQQQQQDNNRKSQVDFGYIENKNDDLDLDLPYSRRNPRRAETFKTPFEEEQQKFNNNYSTVKPPMPSGSTFFQTNSVYSKQPETSLSMPPAFNKKTGDSGFPSTRSKARDDDNILQVLEEEDDSNKNRLDYQQFNKGMSFGSSNIPKQGYPFAGGIFDSSNSNPNHQRVKSQDLGSDSNKNQQQQGFSKKGTLQNELDDVLEDCDYNPSSTSRLAASKRPRTGQKENLSQPASMNNTQNNINISSKQQVYPRLMKSPEESQHTNVNNNNNNILNDSLGAQQKYARSQGNKNESSYISDKDLMGVSETKEGPQQFDDNLNLDTKLSRRSSYMRGGVGGTENKISNQNQPHSAFFQSTQQNQGPLSDIHDLKMSETNFQQNQGGSNYGSEKAPANPKQYQMKQNQEELSIKVLKQMEEERKNMRVQINQEHDETLKKMKQNYEDQIKSLKENYEQLLKFERDRNQQQQDEIKEIIIKDRERQRQLFDIEIENLKASFEKEKTQIQMTNQLQSDSLKKQLQQQAEIIGLAEQLKQNSEKLNTISYQIENNQERNQVDMQKLNHEIQEKQKFLKDLESRLKLEQEFIDAEKKRIDKQKTDLASMEENQRSYLEKEKQLIRTEYQRLTELQDQIKDIDTEKKREIIHERNKLETERLEVQEERIKLKEEYERMYKDFELKVTIFEQTKMEFERGQNKIEDRHSSQIKEIEQKKMDLLKQEQLIVQKTKLLELKEYELKQQEHEYTQMFRQVKSEKINFDTEKRGLKALVDKIDQENDGIREFKSNFDLERMKLAQKEQDLQEQEKNIRRQQDKVLQEKREVTQLQDTLRNLRSNFVKGLVNSPPNSLALANSFQNFLSPSKPPTDTLGFRSPQNNYTSQRLQQNPQNSFRSPDYEQRRQYYKEVEREVSFREKQQTEGYSKQVMHQRFDLKGFMNQLQEVENKQMGNVGYIMTEKDNLYSSRPKDRFPTFNFNDNDGNHSQSERSINAHSYIEN